MNPLVVRGVRVTYGDVVALHDIDLEVAPGTLLAVTGPSGAGKSSLLWALAGALVPSAGTVHLGDEAIRDREQATGLGVVLAPQGNALATALTSYENVLVPMLAAGVPPAEAAERTRAALEQVGLEESGNHLTEELSGGQQQRVALARAFAAHAAVLLADEPTSDLDSGNRERMIAGLRAEARRGAVVVMSTHDPEAALQADAEVTLDEGAMTWVRHGQSGRPDRPPPPVRGRL
ncbi:MAG: transporter related protein [Nocardioidaceae bacterium]|nr:transporter related protein [Nocardioidaceae bacterium]